MNGALGRIWLSAALASLVAGVAVAERSEPTVKGRTLYVPAYSHVFHGEGKRYLDLTVTPIVRNTDSVHPIELTSVEYHDSEGKPVRRYLQGPRKIGALASAEFPVKESDTSGGHGPSFLVRWRSAGSVHLPLAETVMIGTAGTQGISFVGRARVLAENR